MTNACLTHLLHSPCDLPAAFLPLPLHLLTEHLPDLPPTSFQPLLDSLLPLCTTSTTTDDLRLSLCHLLLRLELHQPKSGDSRLTQVAAGLPGASEVAETVRVYEKIVEMAEGGGGWEELFSEELNKPSIQL